ncbi:hypothetical protein CtesDRAFT_PD1862 [Comamonas testosteroni KF-1]|uniref:Uncharacterized protein n=1 Tax=Comamonas testosteroni (strain DSM 14576 / KF-1) TaxID=399795 RepID=B7X5C4_COMTK|nr:hypothetical protein CtesDRAFT_PD1862 [Comamonas testosteroni KF-1]
MPQKSQNAQKHNQYQKTQNGFKTRSDNHGINGAYLAIGKQGLVGIDCPHGTLESILYREVASEPQYQPDGHICTGHGTCTQNRIQKQHEACMQHRLQHDEHPGSARSAQARNGFAQEKCVPYRKGNRK